MNRTLLGLTMGDCNGIGPEVILKAAARLDRAGILPLAIGREEVFRHYNSELGIGLELLPVKTPEEAKSANAAGQLLLLESGETGRVGLRPGTATAQAGKEAMAAVDTAIRHCLAGRIDAIVTAPISKEAIALAGYSYPGHTEFLAARTDSSRCQMILVGEQLRVALATIHAPLADVPSLLTDQRLDQQITLLDESLRLFFGIEEPVIDLLALNPHAGDGGVIGREEIERITPAIERAKDRMIDARGPFPADAYFARKFWLDSDAVLAMYHDQGLIPFKTLVSDRGVNVTTGLPLIRTSPDHGTAFNIAGTGKASENSFFHACLLASELVNIRRHRA